MSIALEKTQSQDVTPPRRYQILTDLVACDGEYNDSLNFCLITLDAVQINSLLDAHREWRRVFPNALELVLRDTDFAAQYLTGDEEENVRLPQNTEYQVIEGEPLTLTEDDNDADAWQIELRKVIIRETDVRFTGLYEYTYILQNAFTTSRCIPINVLRELLEKSIAVEISDTADQAH